MLLKPSATIAAAAAILLLAAPANAKDPSPKKLMQMAAGCAYVVSVAEGSNVQLNYGSGDWLGVVELLQERTGIDGEHALAEAKAKYNKRARVMGADEAYRHMLDRAKDCDREMAVLMS